MKCLLGKVKVCFDYLFVIFVMKYFLGFCFVDIFIIKGFFDSKNIVFDVICILLFCNYLFIMYFVLFFFFVVKIL